jgi:hypothetical protein
LPPETPDPNLAGRPKLYRLLRPEFVRDNACPLSSDAFCKVTVRDAEKNNNEIIEATKRLISDVIPEFTQSLKKKNIRQKLLNYETDITFELHKRGINCRFLGLIRALIGDDRELKRLLLTEYTILNSIYNIY